MSGQATIEQTLRELGIDPAQPHSGANHGKNHWEATTGPELVIHCPTNGLKIGSVRQATKSDYEATSALAAKTWETWRSVPAPARGEIVRQLGDELRRLKEPLGRLVSLEAGKVTSEGLGEVQEMIDICDFAVGLARTVGGCTMPSERPNHRMMEQWHPLGPIGIVTAFNFPVAVWAWNAALAAIAGDTMIWKPSSKTPFTAIATQIIASRVAERNGFPGVFNLIIGRGADVGEVMLSDKRLPLISATGSTRMGKRIAVVVGERLGRTLLELGGNNAIIIMNDANLDLAVRAVAFGAVGTAGQRCTSTRRLILQRDVAPKVVEALKKAYTQVRIGDPLEQGVLMGPLIDQNAVKDMMHAVAEAKKQGGTVVTGGNVHPTLGGNFVEPTIITAPASNVLPISDDETFAPILYVFVVDTLEEAIRMNNAVPQGLSSSIFTSSMYHQEHFLSPAGSDCGIANVNIGTSGAEIGGAFGGDKETGGGRESGSDSWKAYMRRVTNTINYGTSLPLAQGVKFDI